MDSTNVKDINLKKKLRFRHDKNNKWRRLVTIIITRTIIVTITIIVDEQVICKKINGRREFLGKVLSFE